MSEHHTEDDGPVSAAVRLRREIKARRDAAGLSQPQLAIRVGYTRQYISQAERPGHNLPSFELVTALDAALGADGALIALRQAAKREQQALRQNARGADLPADPSVVVPAQTSRRVPSALSAGQVPEVVDHLTEQWHLLVKTDNMLGPRFALGPVLAHLELLRELMRSTWGRPRTELARVASQYAESAAWLHEAIGDERLAEYWTDRAMEWAHEADDRPMLAWTLFRRSQQAAAAGEAARTVGLAEAAQRYQDVLPNPMKAAILQQEARGHALDGDVSTAERKIDQAHKWAGTDTEGDARNGHGSFCTPDYLELQRAVCWLEVGQAGRAVKLFEVIVPNMPSVYRQDRGTALSRFAVAAARIGEPEYAAHLADEALDIARSSGSVRTENELRTLGELLGPLDHVPSVAAFRSRLALNDPS
ncbi:helix-turn-helix transcriptional regulator [Actinosynnema sp. CA-248983]